MSKPTPVIEAILVEAGAEQARSREKYPIEHDRSHGVHHLVLESRRSGSSCGFYHREELIRAIGLLASAVEVLDASENRHDCDRGR